jgi:hypothetical protein
VTTLDRYVADLLKGGAAVKSLIIGACGDVVEVFDDGFFKIVGPSGRRAVFRPAGISVVVIEHTPTIYSLWNADMGKVYADQLGYKIVLTQVVTE